MSRQTLEAHYRPNWNLTQAHGLAGYNCGYARRRGECSFDQHQKDLVWQLLAHANIGPDTRMLDIGCGIGGPARWIVERFAPRQLIGLEYCWSSVRAAAHGPARIPGQGGASAPDGLWFMQGDAHALPLPDASVDVIFNLESALHYSDKPRFLAECRRVLVPGGMLCLGDITTAMKSGFARRLIQGAGAFFKSTTVLWNEGDYRRAFAAEGLALQHHEQASQSVAGSLADGLNEIRKRGWQAARGYRMRFFYLSFLEMLLRRGWLHYDLFALTRPA